MFGDGRLLPQQGDEILGCHLDAPLSGQREPLVWRAWQASESRDVVVKLVPRREASLVTARHLAGTARLLATLAPPSAARVLEGADLGQHLALVAELAPGEELTRSVRSDGPWAPRRAVAVVTQLAACLDEVHRAGSVHGRIDPRHVRVSGSGRSERATLVELGLRRRGRLTGPHAGFVAPEMRFDDVPTVAGDVFSLAALLHFMLTGVQPGDQAAAGVPRPGGERGRVLAIARLGLAASPADRPPGARALADAAAVALDVETGFDAFAQTAAAISAERPYQGHETLVADDRADEPPVATSVAATVARGDVAAPAPRNPSIVVMPLDPAEVPARAPQAPRQQGRRLPRSAARPRPAGGARAYAGADAYPAVARDRLPPMLRAASAVAFVAVGAVLIWRVQAHDAAHAQADAGMHSVMPDSAPQRSATPRSAPSMQPAPGAATSPVEITGGGDGPRWGTIRPGVLGPQVTAFQWLLFARGAGPTPDGVYDALTAQAISDFQVSAGLPATGVVDPATWMALAVPVAPGDQGPRVRALQQLLRTQQPLPVDGTYGERTADAVAAFQRRSGLALSGEADVETWAALSRTSP